MALTWAPRADAPLCPIRCVNTYLECTALPGHPLAPESLANPLLLVILAPRHPLYVYGYPFPDGSMKETKISVVSAHRLSGMHQGPLRCTRGANGNMYRELPAHGDGGMYHGCGSAAQSHPLTIVADTTSSITTFTLWWFVFWKNFFAGARNLPTLRLLCLAISKPI